MRREAHIESAQADISSAERISNAQHISTLPGGAAPLEHHFFLLFFHTPHMRNTVDMSSTPMAIAPAIEAVAMPLA